MENRTYNFAEFRLSVADGLLRSGNASVRLQDKPLRLLTALLDHPQELVTREQLRERMWDSRTVVDYEQSINVAMRKVRDALGDSADTPRFIETIARKGYRFLIPVELVDGPVRERARAEPNPVGRAEASSPADSTGSANHKPGLGKPAPRRLIAGAVVLGLLCAFGIGWYGSKSNALNGKDQVVHSLAVLPLQDLSPDVGQEYLVDGITEEVITSLAQALPVRVISRSSVMQYRHTDKAVTQIARELGVDAIVEGSVARSGDRLTVTVQLIDATADRHLWAQQYNRRLSDILTVESDLSQTIARQVHNTLTQRRPALAKPGPVDPAVYELYLLGRYHWNKRTAPDFVKAEHYFHQAIERDPNFAQAHAGLADVYAMAPSYGPYSIADGAAKATAEAQRALSLNDELAEPHATLGLVHLATVSEWPQSEAEFRRALESDPNYANAHHWLAYDLMFFGRRDEALAEISLARQIDPLSAITTADEGAFLYASRRFDDARVRLQRAIDLAPELGQPHATLSLVELESGHSAEAMREARAALALDPDNPRTMSEVGYVMASTGDAGRAKELLAKLQILALEGSSNTTFPAMIEIGLGQVDQAVDTLKDHLIPFAQLGLGLASLSQWHAFDALPSNAHYRELVAGAVKLSPANSRSPGH